MTKTELINIIKNIIVNKSISVKSESDLENDLLLTSFDMMCIIADAEGKYKVKFDYENISTSKMTVKSFYERFYDL